MAVSNYALISLYETKLHLGITDTASDEILELLIDTCSVAIESYCRNGFVQREYIEDHRGPLELRSGRARLHLRKSPVVSVTSIVDQSGYTVSTADYIILDEQGILEGFFQVPFSSAASSRPSFLTVTYTAGKYASTATVADDLKLAALLLVSKRYGAREADVSSISIGSLSLSYGNSMTDLMATRGLPVEVASLLGPHKRMLI